MLEKQIEEKVCEYAKDRGVLVYKFTSPQRRAVPDRMFIFNGGVMFIEFKRKGEKPTPPQIREHDRLRRSGMSVFVCDDIDEGLEVIDEFVGRNQDAYGR